MTSSTSRGTTEAVGSKQGKNIVLCTAGFNTTVNRRQFLKVVLLFFDDCGIVFVSISITLVGTVVTLGLATYAMLRYSLFGRIVCLKKLILRRLDLIQISITKYL